MVLVFCCHSVLRRLFKFSQDTLLAQDIPTCFTRKRKKDHKVKPRESGREDISVFLLLSLAFEWMKINECEIKKF